MSEKTMSIDSHQRFRQYNSSQYDWMISVLLVLVCGYVVPNLTVRADTFEVAHGYEIAPGWWGWYDGTEGVAKALSRPADRAIADPKAQ